VANRPLIRLAVEGIRSSFSKFSCFKTAKARRVCIDGGPTASRGTYELWMNICSQSRATRSTLCAMSSVGGRRQGWARAQMPTGCSNWQGGSAATKCAPAAPRYWPCENIMTGMVEGDQRF
jgi:hypothetical protein